MNCDGEQRTVLETLDSQSAGAVERVLRDKAIAARRSRVPMTLTDGRLRQLGTRLEIAASDGDAAKQIADQILMRRARLLSRHRRARQPARLV
jgi:hypothetical protein